MVRAFLLLVLVLCYGVAAANNDDGFVWVDANTKIRLKPIGSAAAGASVPEKAPEPAKRQKRQKQKK